MEWKFYSIWKEENKHGLFDINILIKHSMHIEAYAKFRGTKTSKFMIEWKENHQIISIYNQCFKCHIVSVGKSKKSPNYWL